MTKWTLRALALSIATLMNVSGAYAQGPWTLDSELLLMQLHTSVGTGDNNVFDYDTAHRFTLGRSGNSGLGGRISYFGYDHARTDTTVGDISLTTYNIDMEAFKRLNVTKSTKLELSAGTRYNDTQHFYDDPTSPNDFFGFGGIFGLRGATQVRTGGQLFARAKWAILLGEGRHDASDEALDPAFEVVRDQMEIACGYQHSIAMRSAIITPRIAAEWQSWKGFGIDPVDEHPDNDLGLGGFSFGLGINR